MHLHCWNTSQGCSMCIQAELTQHCHCTGKVSLCLHHMQRHGPSQLNACCLWCSLAPSMSQFNPLHGRKLPAFWICYLLVQLVKISSQMDESHIWNLKSTLTLAWSDKLLSTINVHWNLIKSIFLWGQRKKSGLLSTFYIMVRELVLKSSLQPGFHIYIFNFSVVSN